MALGLRLLGRKTLSRVGEGVAGLLWPVPRQRPFERELILARTGDGRARAKAKGVRFGRPRKLTPHQRQEALQRLAAGETQADVARTYNVDAAAIGRLGSPSPFGSGAALQ